MTEGTDHDPNGDDLVAAEYVLGVLPAEERQVAARRIALDPAFARLVESWEARLDPLAADYAAVEPPAAVRQALEARLFGAESPKEDGGHRLLHSLGFWRTIAVTAVLALAIVMGTPFLKSIDQPPAIQLAASLRADGSDVSYFAFYDHAAGQLTLSHIAGTHAAEQDFELWLIEGDNRPISLGVVPLVETTRLELRNRLRPLIGTDAVLAISLEPQGGSPTGQPTGPVVAAGGIKPI
jgi:anti-sigma-K factor RskA